MNKLRIKSFIAFYYAQGWEEGAELLDTKINAWMEEHPNIVVEKIKHTRFETHEAIHIWYY